MVNGSLNNFSQATVPLNFAGQSTKLSDSGYYPFIAVKYFDEVTPANFETELLRHVHFKTRVKEYLNLEDSGLTKLYNDMVPCTEEEIRAHFVGKTEINFVKKKTVYFCIADSDYESIELKGSYAGPEGYSTIELNAIHCENQDDCVTDETELASFLNKVNVYPYEIAEEINFAEDVVASTGRPLEFVLKRSDSLGLEQGYSHEITQMLRLNQL